MFKEEEKLLKKMLINFWKGIVEIVGVRPSGKNPGKKASLRNDFIARVHHAEPRADRDSVTKQEKVCCVCVVGGICVSVGKFIYLCVCVLVCVYVC